MMAMIFLSLKFQCTLYHAFENGLLTNLRKYPARQYLRISIVCCKTGEDDVNMGITSHSNIICQFDM